MSDTSTNDELSTDGHDEFCPCSVHTFTAKTGIDLLNLLGYRHNPDMPEPGDKEIPVILGVIAGHLMELIGEYVHRSNVPDDVTATLASGFYSGLWNAAACNGGNPTRSIMSMLGVMSNLIHYYALDQQERGETGDRVRVIAAASESANVAQMLLAFARPGAASAPRDELDEQVQLTRARLALVAGIFPHISSEMLRSMVRGG